MPTYSTEDYERIAAAVGQDVGDVVEHRLLFEWAADWYGLDCGLPRDVPPPPRRTPPSKMHEKLLRIAKSASRLLKDLEIRRSGKAMRRRPMVQVASNFWRFSQRWTPPAKTP
jgi:hypothetical protein